MGRQNGGLAIMDMHTLHVVTEFYLGGHSRDEVVRDGVFLHNHTLFALAQKHHVFVYDDAGVEIHCLPDHVDVYASSIFPIISYSRRSDGADCCGITIRRWETSSRPTARRLDRVPSYDTIRPMPSSIADTATEPSRCGPPPNGPILPRCSVIAAHPSHPSPSISPDTP